MFLTNHFGILILILWTFKSLILMRCGDNLLSFRLISSHVSATKHRIFAICSSVCGLNILFFPNPNLVILCLNLTRALAQCRHNIKLITEHKETWSCHIEKRKVHCANIYSDDRVEIRPLKQHNFSTCGLHKASPFCHRKTVWHLAAGKAQL